MTRQQLEASVRELTALTLAGKVLEAFENYYHPAVVMQENETAPRVGKAVNRALEQDFLAKINRLRDYSPVGYVVGDNLSYLVWHMDLHHQDWGSVNFNEIAIQHWQDGLITKEKFVYER